MLMIMPVGLAAATPSPWGGWPELEAHQRTVYPWNRFYRVSAFGLPEQITSAGAGLLAGPVELDIRAGGRPITLIPSRPPRPICDPHAIRYVAGGASPTLRLDSGIARLLDDYGVYGLYLDGASYPVACANLTHGCGYALCDSRPSPTLTVAHMSSLLSLPSLSFADVLLTGEQYWKAPEDYRLPLESIQAECMGHNHGIPTHFIGSPPRGGEYARPVISLHSAPSPWCPGGVEMWRLYDRFDADGAVWHPHWADAALAEADVAGVLVSGFRHPEGRALLAIGNTSRAEQSVGVTFALPAAFGAALEAQDAYTAEPVPVQQGACASYSGPRPPPGQGTAIRNESAVPSYATGNVFGGRRDFSSGLQRYDDRTGSLVRTDLN